MSCVTGPSGSGKSSLIFGTLRPALERLAGGLPEEELAHEAVSLPEGARVPAIVSVDQAPLGRSSRANPATYLGAWDHLRKELSRTELARERGYKPGFFSFNVAGGRCEVCRGEGAETVEMQFLSDVTFSCASCGGSASSAPYWTCGCAIIPSPSYSI